MANLSSAWMDKSQPKGLHWDRRHHGLGVRVWANGTTKSWVFQKSGGRRVTLGRWPTMEVNEARLAAAELNERPADRRRTLEDAHETWARDHVLRGGAQVTVDQNKALVGKHAPDWWARDAASIDKSDLLDLRSDIATRAGVHPARDTVGHIRRLVALATDKEIRLPELRRPKSERGQRSAAIEEWWPDIEAEASPVMLDAHRVCALTGLRRSEVLGMRRDNIEGDRIFIPAPKSKMGEDLSFWRPLPEQVRKIIDRQPSNDRVFPLEDIRLKCGSFSHRLRHHFIGVAESETAVPRRVLRALVNHTAKTDVTDGYGTVTPEAAAQWSQEIANVVAGKIGL
ncbi:MAG: integrase family protein [Pseudomonadota bacterium]